MGFRRRDLLKLAGLAPLLGLPFLAGCAAASPLAVAVRPLVRDQTLRLALDLHFVGREHLSIAVETPRDRQLGLAGGWLHAATLALADVILLRTRGIDLVVVAVTAISSGADAVMVPAAAERSLPTRGLRVGLEDTAQAAVMLGLWLDRAGLRRQHVHAVTIGPDHVRAWGSHGLDAIVTDGIQRPALEGLGLRAAMDTRGAAGTMIDTLAVPRALAERNATALRAILAGHFRAVRHLRENAADAVPRIAGTTGLPTARVAAVLGGLELPDEQQNFALMAGPGGEMRSAASRSAGWLQDARLIGATPRLDDLLDSRFLPATP